MAQLFVSTAKGAMMESEEPSENNWKLRHLSNWKIAIDSVCSVEKSKLSLLLEIVIKLSKCTVIVVRKDPQSEELLTNLSLVTSRSTR